MGQDRKGGSGGARQGGGWKPQRNLGPAAKALPPEWMALAEEGTLL